MCVCVFYSIHTNVASWQLPQIRIQPPLAPSPSLLHLHTEKKTCCVFRPPIKEAAGLSPADLLPTFVFAYVCALSIKALCQIHGLIQIGG